MNCPKCGRKVAEGMAYCANPACGAVLEKPRPAEPEIKTGKEARLSNFVSLARLAAFVLAALAFLYRHFFTGR